METLPHHSIDFSDEAAQTMNIMSKDQYCSVIEFITELFIGATDLYRDRKLAIFDADSERTVRRFFDGKGGAKLLLSNSAPSLEMIRRPEWGLRVLTVTFATRH